MPTVEEVARAAGALRREGLRVSVRSVRSRLPRGGSPNVVARLLVRWKAEASYRPDSVAGAVPASLSKATDVLAAELWKVARAEAERVVEVERRRLDLLRRECETSVEVAWAEAERSEDETRRLRSEVTRLRERLAAAARGRIEPPLSVPRYTEEELARRAAFQEFVRTGSVASGTPDVEVKAREDHTDLDVLLRAVEATWAGPMPQAEVADGGPDTARAYWDGLMRDVGDLLAPSGSDGLAVPEILALLAGTPRGKDARFTGLTVALLRRKLGERADAGKYVRKTKAGRFVVLTP